MEFEGTIQEITLLMHGEALNSPYVEVQQYDAESRKVRIHLETFGNEKYIMPDGAKAVFCVIKQDGKRVLNDCLVEDQSTVLATLSKQTLVCAGKQKAQIYIYTSDGDIRSQAFYINIPKAVLTDEVIESTDEYGILVGLINDNKEIQEAELQRRNAEAAREAEEADRMTGEEIREEEEGRRQANETARVETLEELKEIVHDLNIETMKSDIKNDMEAEVGGKFEILKDNCMSWSQWFDMHRTGWHGGVHFNRYDASPSPLGTKTGDNAEMVMETSTNTVAGRDDYKGNLLFDGIVCNGYYDEDGEPHITAVEGSPEFARDGSNGDVWVAFLTPYYKRIYTDTEDSWDFSDLPLPGYLPEPHALRPDGTVRSFYMIAKYSGVLGDDGKVASISGRAPIRNVSESNQIAKFAAKGSQYCGFTDADVFWTIWQFEMKYATKNLQSKLCGCTSYYLQYPATVAEEGVTRIIISKANANNLVVGSAVSVGYGGISNGAVYLDRGNANIHAYADDVRILKIEDYDDASSAVYVDAKMPFDTAPVVLNDTLTSPVYISTMHWLSGSCDDVLGADGSPSNCTNGKEPFVLSKVELGHGGYVVISNVILNGIYDAEADTYKQTPYVTGDSRNIATSVTGNYDQLAFDIPDTNNAWSFGKESGYDARYPYNMFPGSVGASSSTGTCDGVNTGTRANGTREWLWFGNMSYGAADGLRCVNADCALSYAWWNILLRLSSLRRGVAAQG